MEYSEIFKQISKEQNLPIEVVEEVYKSFYKFIRSKIIELPLKDELSKEEFLKLRTNFNIPSLGKLSCSYDRYLRMKEKQKYLEKFRHNET